MIDIPKQALRWSGFKPRSNHLGHMVGVAELTDASGVTIPGHTVQIEIKAPVDVARCLYLFSIMRLHNKQRDRVYQLEVAPRSKRTHNGATIIYGPHEHVGEAEPTPITDTVVNCDNWAGALQWFFNRVAIQPFDIEDPTCHVEL